MRFISQQSKNLILQFKRKTERQPFKTVNQFINIASMNNNEKIQFDEQDNTLFTTIYDYQIHLDVIDMLVNKIIIKNQQEKQITDRKEIENILKDL